MKKLNQAELKAVNGGAIEGAGRLVGKGFRFAKNVYDRYNNTGFNPLVR
ncbi:hypothetical protein MHK01_01835 [Staphylococcus auricularis]|nr:hypothetical protein [Staphylococcus auricularis]MCG7340774.1 hypothetical protein [Staphylococcus auricularis]